MNDISSPSRALALLEELRRALVECSDFKKLDDLRDRAEAIRHYAKSAAMNLEIQNRAGEIKLLCERRIGSLLADLSLPGGDHTSPGRNRDLTLADLGISPIQSSRYQRESSVPEKDFVRYVQQTKVEGRELTSQGLLHLAKVCADAAKPDDDKNPFEALTKGLMSLAQQQRRFACIYADPPWRPQRKRKIANLHKGLCRLPVKLVAAQQAHLHLWVPPESLLLGLSVLLAWGFRYKAVLVRSKAPLQYGNYWRPEHDMLLLGVRGALPFRDNNLSSWLDGHDQTPENSLREICGLVNRVSPSPYLDLLGTTLCTDWTAAVPPRSW